VSAGMSKKGSIAIYLAFALILLFFALPLLWLLSLAVRTPAEIFVAEVRIVPRFPTLRNFEAILQNPQFLVYLWNGLKLSIAGAASACLAAAPAAFAFSRFEFGGRSQLLFALLALQMISPLVIMVPLYRYMRALGLTEIQFGAALVYAAISAPIATWILKGSFDAIPRELEEAAMIDGCSRWRAFLLITLPIGVPGLASAFVLTAMLGWSQFMVPFILLSQPHMLPISVGVFNFLGAYTGSATQLVAAASILSLLPAIAIFVVFQKFVVGALTAGALKE
jgi:multiple sugar transport system permease protein